MKQINKQKDSSFPVLYLVLNFIVCLLFEIVGVGIKVGITVIDIVLVNIKVVIIVIEIVLVDIKVRITVIGIVGT